MWINLPFTAYCYFSPHWGSQQFRYLGISPGTGAAPSFLLQGEPNDPRFIFERRLSAMYARVFVRFFLAVGRKVAAFCSPE